MSRPLLLLGHTGNAFGKHYIVEEKIQKKLLLGKIVSVQNKFEKQSGKLKIILLDPITYLMKASKILVATKKQLHSYVEFLGFSLKVMRAVSVFSDYIHKVYSWAPLHATFSPNSLTWIWQERNLI